MAPTRSSFQALPLTQNEHRFYFSTIPVDELFPYCFVARRQEDPSQGFQRTLSQDRANDIARYLSAGNGSIPTNVVLSAQPIASLKYIAGSKTLSFLQVERSFLVLDGQHRLWGYSKCTRKHRVPVAIYQGLTRAEEAKLFIDINTNQRGVPAALLLDIKQLADMESVKENIMRVLFDRLNTDGKSSLAGRLSPAKPSPSKISRVAFNRALGGALDSELVRGLEADPLFQLVRNYINAFDAELQDSQLLTRASYFEAMFDIFDEALRLTLGKKKNLKQASIQEIIRTIAKLDFTGQSMTRKEYLVSMQSSLRQSLAVSVDML
ncbi:DGQHR domain-containing protein [Granulicella tundricola]|uniref:DGQHR domain protein n=1 Tax=Granulicella tundricola (strain ATCC BAA-1859 / DSM 23138 / MP5ACTX9) TaxID=1198114 RepID=E8X1T2_GRATM|nr:DGQHR domain-containing protein [Granulicella tundricola]ADW68001.1 DGQHR domain protein [Granulicella tundricola MP5ACTX9]